MTFCRFTTTDFHFSLYYKATVIKTIWYWHRNRNIDQWNGVKRSEIKLCTYCHLIYDKGWKNIHWKKDNLFNKWNWENWRVKGKKKERHSLAPYTEMNSNWLQNLNIRHYTTKLLEEKRGKTFSDTNHTNILLGQSPKAIEIKAN